MGKKNRRQKDTATKRVRIKFVARPFAGLEKEAELVAMREILPAATLPAKTNNEYGAEEFLFVTQLPQLAGALRRQDGKLLVAMQTVMQSGNASLDVADRLRHGLELAPGESYQQSDQPLPGAGLAEMLADDFSGELEVKEDFRYCFTEEELKTPEVKMALEQSQEAVVPMEEVPGVPNTYLAKLQKVFLRWLRPEDEEDVLDGLARLQSRRELEFSGGRFLGAFRALGLLIPVFELEPEKSSTDIAAPLQEFAKRLEMAIACKDPLSAEEKRAKAGIISRQVTLR